MPDKRVKRLKATATGLAVISVLGFVYFAYITINLYLLLIGNVDAKGMNMNLMMILISLKPAIFLALIISALGLYRSRRWGLYLANTSMAAYLATFAISIFGKPDNFYLIGLYQPNPHWPSFIKYSFNWDTLVLPASIVLFLILINLTRMAKDST